MIIYRSRLYIMQIPSPKANNKRTSFNFTA